MYIDRLIGMGLRFLLVALVMVFILAFLFHIIYRRVLHKKEPIQYVYALKGSLLMIYVLVVLAATLIADGERGGFHLEPQWSLFASYKIAWISMSVVQWLNLILNICMFVPLGIIIPSLFKKCQHWWVTYGIGFLFSFSIECLQLLTQRGLFEIDDMLNNTIGCMIGYGIYMICHWIHMYWTKEKEVKVKNVLIAQLPLLITIGGFTTLYVLYENQELGNLKSQYTQVIDMSEIDISMKKDLSHEHRQDYVYQKHEYEKDQEEFAKEFLKRVGAEIDHSKIQSDNEMDFYTDNDSRHSLWINKKERTFRYKDNQTSTKDGLSGLSQTEIQEILTKYGVTTHNKMKFVENGNGVYELTAHFFHDRDQLLNGKIQCQVNKNRQLSSLQYQMLCYDQYKAVQLMSEQEAYQKIVDGKFSSYYITSIPNELHFTHVTHSYELDSKGFYQPVYIFQFQTETDKNIQTIFLPAVQS